MPSHERIAMDYGSRRGWAIRTHTLTAPAPHWRATYYGQADVVPGTVIPRAEGAWIASTPDSLRALVLWHEMGHCEQAELALIRGDFDTNFGPWADINGAGETFLLEADAWDRGLVMAAECGYVLTAEMAEVALSCLLSYATGRAHTDLLARYWMRVADVPVVRYLEGVAYGE